MRNIRDPNDRSAPLINQMGKKLPEIARKDSAYLLVIIHHQQQLHCICDVL